MPNELRMTLPLRADSVEEQVRDVVHTLHCRYPLFATVRLLRQAIATATLGILTRLHPSQPRQILRTRVRARRLVRTR